MPLTEQEEIELLTLLNQQEIEKVSPKLEIFRQPKRIKLAYGGRGAGAKSWSIASLIVQRAQKEQIRVLCTREIQISLEESVYNLIMQTVQRLNYKGWAFMKEHIFSPSGARFTFRGLKDLRAASQIKGYEDYDIFWVEEAASVSHESWSILIPTLRKSGSELWISFNRETEFDPVYERFCINPRDDAYIIQLEPGDIDNPWWTDELQKEMEEDYKRNPDEAIHIWGGEPRKQGAYSIFSRVAVKQAMDRNILPEGVREIGVDVARSEAGDRTEIYMRHGLKVIGHKELRVRDTMLIANEAWTMANKNPSITIKVDDTGVGGGVTDKLRELGAKVFPINFGSSAIDKDRYTTIADELWFNFPIDEVDIPNDPDLAKELAGRQYAYDSKGRRKIEQKDIYKKRNGGQSPDKADALLLTFYQQTGIIINKALINDLSARRQRQ